MSTTAYKSTTQTFDINKIFDLCKIKSLYAASNVANDSGVTQEKNLAITDNERDFFDITLKNAASNVYDAVSQDTKIVDNPFDYNVNGAIVFRLMVHGQWDHNHAFGLNTAIEVALCDFVCREWFKLRNMNLYQVFEQNYTQAISSVKNLLNRRVTPAKKVYRYV